MKLSMLVTDLDGTLLQRDKSVSRLTRRTLERCRALGLKVVYATARPMRTLRPVMEAVPCDAVAYHNGAVVQAADGWRAVNAIPRRSAMECIAALERDFPGIHLSMEAGGTLYRNFVPEEPGRFPGEYVNLQALEPREVLKLVADRAQFPDPSVLQPYCPPDCYLEPCEDRLLLIMHRTATKLQAAEQLRKRFGMPADEVAAFGDDLNDVEMLSHYYGVAMENGLAEARAAAKEVTISNDRDGVAAFLIREVLDGR